MSLDQLLTDRRDAIVRRFVAELQALDVPPAGTSRTSIVDHIPYFVDDLIRELRGERAVRDAQDVSDVSPTARRHGVQRWELGFELDALVREYGVLRHCILTEAKEAALTISIDEFDTLAKCLNVGVAEAVTAFSDERRRERETAHERVALVAEAGKLLSSSLDSQATLTRLTRIAVPRLADWCAIHLVVGGVVEREVPVAHVDPSKLDLVRELYTELPWSEDTSAGFPRVIATGETELVGDTSQPSLALDGIDAQHRALLTRLGTTSWIIVPLRVQRTTFGALTLAFSDSGRHHGPEDIPFAEDLAARAAAAIDNALLYELSNRERARVEAATRAKDEFVAMISHELRTPLNAILGWSRLVRSGGLPPEKQSHAVEVIERNAEAQNQLIGDLLDISKINRGTIRIDPAQMDLGDVVEMVIEGIRPAADAKRVTVVANLDRKSGILRGDAERLRQVVWNLLTNAVKFTPKGGRIDVTMRRVESDVEVVVQDTGIGIAAEFIPHMFDSFRQSDASATRAHGGLGVGLAIAKTLVLLHGGTLQGSSDGEGRGARFVVRLPLSSLVSATIGVRRVPALGRAADDALPQGLDGLKVLVVDDEEDARELLQTVLETCGVVVCAVASAAAALEALATFEADVIVSDVGMAGADGYSLIRQIRSSPSETLKRIPAIALTGYASTEDRNVALLSGFNLHAPKPADPLALVTMIADLAGRHATDA